MKIKTFPLRFTEDKLNNIREASRLEDIPMYEFIEKAIDEKMEKAHGRQKDVQ